MPTPDRVLTVALLLLLFMSVCGLFVLILMKRKRKQPGPSRECGESVLVPSAERHCVATSLSAAFWSLFAQPRLATKPAGGWRERFPLWTPLRRDSAADKVALDF